MLIKALQQIQSREHLNDGKFASLLGIHRGTWNRIRRRKQTFGHNFLKKVKKAFPELTETVDIFLLGDITEGKEIMTVGNSIESLQATPDKDLTAFRRLLRALHIENLFPDRAKP